MVMRKVFFSFHYAGDIIRIGQVRNSWITKGKSNTFLDKAKWEQVKRKGNSSIKTWIKTQLKGTSVTIVLIGAETSKRDLVNYEIEQSVLNGNALIGIYLNNLKDLNAKTDRKGKNPFRNWCIAEQGNKKIILKVSDYQNNSGFLGKYKNGNYLSAKTYDWKLNDGYKNIEKWIETAIKNKKW